MLSNSGTKKIEACTVDDGEEEGRPGRAFSLYLGGRSGLRATWWLNLSRVSPL